MAEHLAVDHAKHILFDCALLLIASELLPTLSHFVSMIFLFRTPICLMTISSSSCFVLLSPIAFTNSMNSLERLEGTDMVDLIVLCRTKHGKIMENAGPIMIWIWESCRILEYSFSALGTFHYRVLSPSCVLFSIPRLWLTKCGIERSYSTR